MGDTANEEDILKLKPDIILYAGVINDPMKAKVEEAQRLGIPVVMVDKTSKTQTATYNFMGKLLNEEERTHEFAEYCQATLDEAEKAVNKIPEDSRLEYYACGENGLMTYAEGNVHAELIEIVGAQNIAEVKASNPYQNSQISMEQLMKWNPDIIVTNKVEARGGKDASTLFTGQDIRT